MLMRCVIVACGWDEEEKKSFVVGFLVLAGYIPVYMQIERWGVKEGKR